MTEKRRHIVLLGDSIFDNQVYVNPGEPDVRTQLQALLPDGDKATLLAIDGDVINGVSKSQLGKLPPDATHLVVSVGGNDLLGQMMILGMDASSVADALNRMADIADTFEQQYQTMLVNVLRHNLSVTLCTIYNAMEPDPQLRRLIKTALPLFNDIIIRHANRNNLAIIELRMVCSEPADFANPIEPSAVGGAKIANAIYRAVTGDAAHAKLYK